MSQYIGDLKNIDCYNRHLNTIEHLQTLLDTNPKISIEDCTQILILIMKIKTMIEPLKFNIIMPIW